MNRLTFWGAAILCPVLLAGCNTGSGQVDNTLGTAAGQQQQAAITAPADPNAAPLPPPDEFQDPRGYCPKTVLRAGTETFNVFPPGVKPDDPELRQKLQYRATITGVVRECNTAGEMMTMKVGVEGRILSGPTGQPGTFTMPIRIAVTEGGELLYSKLHEVPAEIPAGRTNNTFRFVDAQVVFRKPQRENVVVYAGYDEQRVDLPGAQAKGEQKPLRPVN